MPHRLEQKNLNLQTFFLSSIIITWCVIHCNTWKIFMYYNARKSQYMQVCIYTCFMQWFHSFCTILPAEWKSAKLLGFFLPLWVVLIEEVPVRTQFRFVLLFLEKIVLFLPWVIDYLKTKLRSKFLFNSFPAIIQKPVCQVVDFNVFLHILAMSSL